MTGEQLDEEHTSAIRTHWRTLTDTGGVPSPGLLAVLRGIAERHADDILHEENGVTGTPAPAAPKPSPRRRTRT